MQHDIKREPLSPPRATDILHIAQHPTQHPQSQQGQLRPPSTGVPMMAHSPGQVPGHVSPLVNSAESSPVPLDYENGNSMKRARMEGWTGATT